MASKRKHRRGQRTFNPNDPPKRGLAPVVHDRKAIVAVTMLALDLRTGRMVPVSTGGGRVTGRMRPEALREAQREMELARAKRQ